LIMPKACDDLLFATGNHAYDYIWYVCGRRAFYNILAGNQTQPHNHYMADYLERCNE